MNKRQQEWKAAGGYTVSRESGIAEKGDDSACTLHFYLAEAGDILHLLDRRYVYTVATYRLNVDPKYIYTYDYQREENWTEYCHDFFPEKFGQEDYIFKENVYFRVIIKAASCMDISGTSFALKGILQWQTGLVQTQKLRLPEYIEHEIENTVQAVSKKQTADSLNFLLMTDSHYTVNGTWTDTVRNLYKAVGALQGNGVNLDGFLHLGDATDGMVQAEITKDYVAAMQEDVKALGIPLYYVIGNHDSNYFGNNQECFTQEEMRNLYLQGREKCYYYKDYPTHHLRMIFLESFAPAEKIRYGFHEEELDWLENLLNQTPGEWYVLIFSHVPPTPRLHYWSKEIRGSRRLLRILRHYQACSRCNFDGRESLEASGTGRNPGTIVPHGHLLGLIHGHNHADQIDYEEGFPIISIGCNKCEYFQDKKPEGAIAYQRALGETSQDLWDVLTISVEKRTLDFTRFGAGEDRHILWRDWDGIMRGKLSACCLQDAHVSVPEGQAQAGNRREEKPMKKVITYGSFDLFHEGHYNILKRAKALGDYLIVGVTTEHYDEQRGKLNIVDPLLERIENVRHTGLVDEIIIEDHEGQKIEDVQKYGVDIFVLGSDWRGVYDYLKPYCQVVYLERTPDISSTMLRKAKYPIICLGVVGSGRIAPRFLSEAKFVSGLNVQCVYNPHKESAEKFGQEYFLDDYSGAYEEFLDAVNAVYIATPHETHYNYARRALLAGKHVLCEKPLAFTRSQAKELFALARERQLVLMEGIKTAFCPGFAQMIGIAKSGKIGEIRDVEACFSRLTPLHLREMVDIRYGGAFMEFGSYTVLPILKLLGLNYEKVEIRSILAENGVDLYTKVYLDYPEGMATSKTGLGVKSEGQLLISGTKGYILAESPWWLTRKFQVRYEDPTRIETYNPNFLGDGLRYEIGEFTSRINGRSGNAFKLTEEESIAMAGVVECFMEERSGQRKLIRQKGRETGIKIWAHRGASYRYPENTLAAFQAACELPGIAGIELDIQMSRDGEVVVFHDETLDRLMNKCGNVQDYTLAQLQEMQLKDWKRGQGAAGEESFLDESDLVCNEELSDGAGEPEKEGHPDNLGEKSSKKRMIQRMFRIPSMREVLDLVRPYSLEKGVKINIELKNSQIPYEGMEEKILSLAAEYGMEDYIVYSSFNGASVRHLKELDSRVRTGILQSDIKECIRLAAETKVDDLHPDVDSMLENEGLAGWKDGTAIRAWNCKEPFYGQVRQYIVYDLQKLKKCGVTDFITNVPEEYLEKC